MLQAKAWEKSNPEVPHVLKALFQRVPIGDVNGLSTRLLFLRIPEGVYSIVT